MLRRLAQVLALASALACPAEAGAQQALPPAPPITPLHFYLAKGDANACGEGCNLWVAVEGGVSFDSQQLMEDFLQYFGALKLPVFFNSSGGSVSDALTIGRQLRKLGVVTGVGVTVPLGCKSADDNSDLCTNAKYGPKPVPATLRPEGVCASACVMTLASGSTRLVPPMARVGIHAIRRVQRDAPDNARERLPTQQEIAKGDAETLAEIRRFYSDMGVDLTLVDRSQAVPSTNVHYLNRDELASFGIDRREFVETPWLFTEAPVEAGGFVSKGIVEAIAPGGGSAGGRKEYRTSLIGFACSNATSANFWHLHGMASSEFSRPNEASISLGSSKTQLVLRKTGLQG